MSIASLLDENTVCCTRGIGQRAVRMRAKGFYGGAHSKSERAAPSAWVGQRFSAPQIGWNRSTRRAGARGGARVGRPKWVRILTITGGSSVP